MREIKFRVWDSLNKEMRYPDFSFFEEQSIRTFPEEYSNRFQIMQYTCLKDSKDTEIYEGDIIKTGLAGNSIASPFIGRVYWSEREFQWWITDDTEDPIEGIDYDLTFLRNYQDCEVIGNVYEHPKLLEQKR